VPFALIDGNTQGYSYERKVAVSPVAVYPVKTGFFGHFTAVYSTIPARG